MMVSGSDGWARAKAAPTSGSWAIREEEGFGLNQLSVYALRQTAANYLHQKRRVSFAGLEGGGRERPDLD